MIQSYHRAMTRNRKTTSKCPPGFRNRKGYTRKNTGTYVKGTCIRRTSPYKYNIKAAEASRKRMMTSRLTRRKRSSATRKRCPKGQIPRASYVRRISSNVASKGYTKKVRSGQIIRIYPKRKSVFVESTCVKDVGKPGKLAASAPKIGPLRKGELAKHGYSYKLPETIRKASLEKAIREYGPLSTYRKLNAVSKLTVKTSPLASATFAADRNWIRSKYAVGGELKAF
jgi:hypothetical protein